VVIQPLKSTLFVDGHGGVICIDKFGQAAYAFNTPFMARARAEESGIRDVGIKPRNKHD
jgi:isoaspartyl peptidase/L-asparaginase-like protein (Ntn-hydrolase superfamily)